MDKKEWEDSLDKLKVMHKLHQKDIEELGFMIECYEKKIISLGEENAP